MILRNFRYIKRPGVRYIHPCWPHFSLADKIKAFLPSLGLVDEMQPSLPKEFKDFAEKRLKGLQQRENIPQLTDDEKKATLETLFKRKGCLPEAVKTVLSEYSFADSMQILENLVLKPERDTENYHSKLRELCFLLIQMNHAPLATQLALDAVEDSAPVLVELELINKLESVELPEDQWDGVIFDNLNCHFPQVLRDHRVNCWTRVRLLRRYVAICKDPRRASVLVRRCLNSSISTEAMYVFLHGSANWKKVMREMIDDQNKNPATIKAFFTGAVNAIENTDQLKATIKYLSAVPPELADKLAQRALDLDRPFELAKITAFFHAAIDNSLLADAFTAFIWHNTSNLNASPRSPHFDQNMLLADPDYSLPVKLLRHLEPSKIEILARRAIKSLTQPVMPPPKPLWSLLLALDHIQHKKSEQLEKALGFLMFRRPLMEQLRYMALPSTLPLGITHLVYLSSQKSGPGANRDLRFEKNDWVEAKLLCAATLLLSEREREYTTLSDRIQALFEDWSISGANKLLGSLNGDKITRSVCGSVISMLDRSKNYRLAQFLLSELDFSNVPPSVVYKLLEHSAEHDYRSFTRVFDWCQAKENHCFLQAQVLRNLVVRLAKNDSVSNTTIMKRLIKVNKILAGRHLMLGPETCTAFVNRLISDAESHNRGSVLRLHWALKLAEQNNVSPHSVAQWQLILSEMKEKQTGFWGSP